MGARGLSPLSLAVGETRKVAIWAVQTPSEELSLMLCCPVRCYWGVRCKSDRSSGTIAPSTGQTWRQMPQSIQVAKSIQNQSVPLLFLPGPG